MAAMRRRWLDQDQDQDQGQDQDDGVGGDDEGDDALVERARVDPAAFALLYRRYVDRIYRYCLRRLGVKEAAEDATARVFTQALAALPAYREGTVRGWLFAMAHNVVVNDLRGARAHQSLDRADAVADPTPSPEEAALRADDGRRPRRLLATLPEEQRQLLELRLAGLSGPEIARVLGKSHGAVKVAQFRAMARLRAVMEADEGFSDEH
ncbi:MAG: RNA polymerase sigma factor [Thermomicrobiales bacterium]